MENDLFNFFFKWNLLLAFTKISHKTLGYRAASNERIYECRFCGSYLVVVSLLRQQQFSYFFLQIFLFTLVSFWICSLIDNVTLLKMYVIFTFQFNFSQSLYFVFVSIQIKHFGSIEIFAAVMFRISISIWSKMTKFS